MIIEVECYLGDALISGNVVSAGELKSKMAKVLKDTCTKDFVSVFCARYHFDLIPYAADIQVNFVMDLDIGSVFIRRNEDFMEL
ncbi:MAG: hypothetical protein ACRDBO_16180 [Lachnospiraceae bacterium]